MVEEKKNKNHARTTKQNKNKKMRYKPFKIKNINAPSLS
jgi:hypothetical protein